jgi:hypothetical protein
MNLITSYKIPATLIFVALMVFISPLRKNSGAERFSQATAAKAGLFAYPAKWSEFKSTLSVFGFDDSSANESTGIPTLGDLPTASDNDEAIPKTEVAGFAQYGSSDVQAAVHNQTSAQPAESGISAGADSANLNTPKISNTVNQEGFFSIRLNQKVTGFADHSKQSSVLFISDTGSLFRLTDLKLFDLGNYQLDPFCNLRSQDSSAKGDADSGMTLTYPYFVGLSKVCVIDETKKTIAVVADFKKSLPKDPFMVSFAGADDQFMYFVLNGRVYPEGESGYINLISVNKRNHSVSIRPLLTDVPGFSGAMFYESGQLWVTVSVDEFMHNEIYRVDSSTLLQFVKNGKANRFHDLAQQSSGKFYGITSFALKNDEEFLFYNKDSISFRIKLDHSQSMAQPFQNPCEPISGYKNHWLLLCSGNTITLE